MSGEVLEAPDTSRSVRLARNFSKRSSQRRKTTRKQQNGKKL